MTEAVRQANPDTGADLLHRIIWALQVPQETKDELHARVVDLHPDEHPEPPPAPPEPVPAGFEEVPGQPGVYRRVGAKG
jgi:hypothetical protein